MPPMAFPEELDTLKRRLKAAGVSVSHVLRDAGVDRSTWTRWGQNQTPRLDRWEAVKAAATRQLADRERDAA